MHTHSPNQLKKFKQTSARKLMASVLWDRKGVLILEYMQQRTTIMSEVYCETLKQLRRTIQNKRCGVLLHENARPHTAAGTWALLEHFDWELFDHPPYSPDLAPISCHLFTYPKNLLGSQCFSSNELMECVETWLSSQAAHFFDTGLQKLIPRYVRYLNSVVTMLRSSLSMYFFVYNKFCFSLLVLLTAHWRLLSK
jgi:transposase